MGDDSILLFSLFESERNYIQSILNQVHKPDDLIIEIGCFRGNTSGFLGKYCKDNGGSLLCIDPWDASQDNSWMYEHECFLKNIKDLPVSFIKDKSNNVDVSNFKQSSLIFVDGDHTLEGCYNDMKKYYPLLKTGGVMLVHDYYEPYWEKNIIGAVNKFINDYNIDPENIKYPQFIEDNEQSIIEHRRNKNSGGFATIFKI